MESAGTLVADYVFGPRIDEPLAMRRSSTTYYFDVDALGSANLLNNSTGTVQNKYVFDVWGFSRSQTVSVANSFGYTSREFAEAGMNFFRARYYFATIGRFNTADSIGLAAGIHVYLYVLNNPTIFVDPMGLEKKLCCDPEEVRAELEKLWRTVNKALAQFNLEHMYVPQVRCQDYAAVVEGAIRQAQPQYWSFKSVQSEEKSLWSYVTGDDVAPAHTATTLRSCADDSWEQGAIWDAYPTGILHTFDWTDWTPGILTRTPVVYGEVPEVDEWQATCKNN